MLNAETDTPNFPIANFHRHRFLWLFAWIYMLLAKFQIDLLLIWLYQFDRLIGTATIFCLVEVIRVSEFVEDNVECWDLRLPIPIDFWLLMSRKSILDFIFFSQISNLSSPASECKEKPTNLQGVVLPKIKK